MIICTISRGSGGGGRRASDGRRAVRVGRTAMADTNCSPSTPLLMSRMVSFRTCRTCCKKSGVSSHPRQTTCGDFCTANVPEPLAPTARCPPLVRQAPPAQPPSYDRFPGSLRLNSSQIRNETRLGRVGRRTVPVVRGTCYRCRRGAGTRVKVFRWQGVKRERRESLPSFDARLRF